MENEDSGEIDYSDIYDSEEERASLDDYRAEMIEAGYGDPMEWDWADVAATQAIDDARGK